MGNRFQPGCPCCTSVIPPTPSPVCISGCNGAAVPGSHVEVRDSHGDVVLSDDTDSHGCTDSILWPAGSYTATITPPVGIAGWDITTKAFTMPGGTVLPFPLHLGDGYTCGCRAPDIHNYFGVGDPKPNLAETLFFSCALGSCAIQWFPWRPGASFNSGIYYGSFTIDDLLSSTNGSVPFCGQLTPKTALVDVFFDPCGSPLGFEVTNQCFQGTSPGPFNFGGLAFGVRYICGCIACNAQQDGLWQYNVVPDPNAIPMADPQDPLHFHDWNGQPNGVGYMGPVYAGNLTIQQDPYLWVADHADAWYGRGLGDCLRVDWCPPGTAIVSE